MTRVLAFAAAILHTYGALCGQTNAESELTKQEILDAYQQRARGGIFLGGLIRESRRAVTVRGWSIRFHRLGEDNGASGMLVKRFRVESTKNGWCNSYALIERVPRPPLDQHVKPTIEVGLTDSKACP